MPRLLVIDDDPNLRTAIRRMLGPTGFEVEEIADGRDAVRTFRARPADLVLCDMFMPEKDGLEVLRDLAREFVGVKVVVMSGGGLGGTVDMPPTARHFGAAGVLYKPFRQADLLEVIRQVSPPLSIGFGISDLVFVQPGAIVAPRG